jgi:calcineurin-like phosphoesterase family protein
VGDVHGKFEQYKTIIRNYPDTIQVGDMGVGFRNYPGTWNEGGFQHNPPHYKMVQMNARFIRGNHDNPEECKKHSQWICDGLIEDGVMFVGGAYSIDKDWRLEGYDWWPDEEISYDDMLRILDIYERNKPRVMVTHDGPEFMLNYYLSHHWRMSTRTGQFFDRLFELHQPEIWIHGHHHISFDKVVKGTRFVVLAELEHKFIEID